MPITSTMSWQRLQKRIARWIGCQHLPAGSNRARLAIELYWFTVIAAWPNAGKRGKVPGKRTRGTHVPRTGWAYSMWHQYEARPTQFATNCREMSTADLRNVIADVIQTRLLYLWRRDMWSIDVMYDFDEQFGFDPWDRYVTILRFH